MDLKLSDPQRQQLVQQVMTMYMEVFDEEISSFRAEQILEAMIDHIGPAIYNMAIRDAQQSMHVRVEDLDALLRSKPSRNTS